jgi:general secretion pathway protein G
MERRNRRRARGWTLLEILVVVTLMTLLSSAAVWAIWPMTEKAKDKLARTSGTTIRQAALSALAQGEAPECPTVGTLVSAQILDEAVGKADPWGTPWNVSCPEGRVVVRSAGRDKRLATADDVVIPQSP